MAQYQITTYYRPLFGKPQPIPLPTIYPTKEKAEEVLKRLTDMGNTDIEVIETRTQNRIINHG